MLTSILNRFTGVGLSVGMLPLLYWIVAIAAGPQCYARARIVLGSLPARVLYAALLFAFAYHLIAGVRHLVWDTGRGMERPQARASAWLLGCATVIAVVVLAWLLAGKWA